MCLCCHLVFAMQHCCCSPSRQARESTAGGTSCLSRPWTCWQTCAGSLPPCLRTSALSRVGAAAAPRGDAPTWRSGTSAAVEAFGAGGEAATKPCMCHYLCQSHSACLCLQPLRACRVPQPPQAQAAAGAAPGWTTGGPATTATPHTQVGPACASTHGSTAVCGPFATQGARPAVLGPSSDPLDALPVRPSRGSTCAAVVKAVLLAALYPNVAVMDDEAAPGAGQAGVCAALAVTRSAETHDVLALALRWHSNPVALPRDEECIINTVLSAIKVQTSRRPRQALQSAPPGLSLPLGPCPAAGKRPAWHDGAGEVAVHPSSVCHPLEAQQYQRPYIVYLEKVGRGCARQIPATRLLPGTCWHPLRTRPAPGRAPARAPLLPAPPSSATRSAPRAPSSVTAPPPPLPQSCSSGAPSRWPTTARTSRLTAG